jgi:hypothetical protein
MLIARFRHGLRRFLERLDQWRDVRGPLDPSAFHELLHYAEPNAWKFSVFSSGSVAFSRSSTPSDSLAVLRKPQSRF